jgi:dihydroflavonol-4-reductase
MSEHLENRAIGFELTGIARVKKIASAFVTGGTGLVGSHLIKELVRQGVPVKALYRSHIPDIECKESVEWIKGDILDVVSLNAAMKNAEQVYHCAAIVSFDSKQKHQMFLINAEGTANVVNAAISAGVKKLCYVSSVAALGQMRKGLEIDESISWNEETSNSNYGKSKYLAEMEVWRGIGEGLEAVVVNPAIILGAGNWNEGSSKIFKTAFEEFPWYTDGESGFVDVIDVVTVMIHLMKSNISGERFIVSSENRRYADIFTAIAKAFQKKPPYKKVTPFISAIVWRVEALKSMFTNKSSLLTRETAQAAQAVIVYNNSKLKKYLPLFNYTPLNETIKRVCKELQQ